MKIEVSNGEIIDKYTILEIKLSKIKDPNKLNNIQQEYDVLTPNVTAIYNSVNQPNTLQELHKNLLNINKELWKIEDDIRACERAKEFDETFINLARAVYITNDKRSVIKKEINVFTGSHLIEEKSYEDYT